MGNIIQPWSIVPLALALLVLLPGCSRGDPLCLLVRPGSRCLDPGPDGMDGVDGVNGTDGTVGTAGAPGTDGTPGAAGMNGLDFPTTSYAGTVDNGGTPGADFLVILASISPDGEPGAALGASVADAAGTFSITQTERSDPSTSLRFEAFGADRELTALVTALDQDVTPATTVVDQIVSAIASSSGGVSMSDYTPDEIMASVSAADSALTVAATDLSDEDAVWAQALMDVGEAIADQSGVDPTVATAAVPAPTPPTDTRVENCCSPGLVIPLANDEEWGIQENGTVWPGSSDAFDIGIGGFRLRSRSGFGDVFQPVFAAPSPEHQLEDGREVVLGPEVDYSGTGLDVTRKIYVPVTGNWARFIEIFENPTAAPITIRVEVDTDLGDGDEIVGPTSSGDMVMDDSDEWVTIDDGDPSPTGRPALGFYLPGAETLELDRDDVEATYEFTVPAFFRVIVVHWAFQRTGGTGDVDTIAAQLEVLATAPPIEYFEGMTRFEIADALFTFSTRQNNVAGGAGAVAPTTLVTATNLTTSIGFTTTAAIDGSFAGTLLAATGEMVQITTSFGRDETITTP